MYIIFAILLVTVIIIVISHDRSQLIGGSREAIFSRFNYTPEFPFISQLDTVDLDRYSKVYNLTDPIKFIAGRPYKYYHTEHSTWVYPWEFPQEINTTCINLAAHKCHEPIIMPKKDEEKLNGLAVSNPKDIVRVSKCFDRVYEHCQQSQ